MFTDSQDVIHLLKSPHPKPKETAMIFDILNTKDKISKVHVAALKDTIKNTTQNHTQLIKHIPEINNIADKLTKASGTKKLLETQTQNNTKQL